MEPGAPVRFASSVLPALIELGPFDPFGADLSLELVLSLSLRRSGISLGQAVDELQQIRRAVLEVAALDAGREPVPLVGRSPQTDVVVLGAYLAHLVPRALAASGAPRRSFVARVEAALAGPSIQALGA
jgi:hypothetical protein